MKNQQNRFSFSKEYAKNSILPLLNGDEDLLKGLISVTVYDHNGKKISNVIQILPPIGLLKIETPKSQVVGKAYESWWE